MAQSESCTILLISLANYFFSVLELGSTSQHLSLEHTNYKTEKYEAKTLLDYFTVRSINFVNINKYLFGVFWSEIITRSRVFADNSPTRERMCLGQVPAIVAPTNQSTTSQYMPLFKSAKFPISFSDTLKPKYKKLKIYNIY